MSVKPGHIVKCENGHVLYRVLVPLGLGAHMRASDFEAIDPEVDGAPQAGSPVKPCPHCGALWHRRLGREVGSPYDETETSTLGPNQMAWCRDNLRGFRLDEPVRRDGV
jgi:hypothetical protein